MARTKEMSEIASFQEREYGFPYHYIPRLEGGNYYHGRYIPNGYEYTAYIDRVLRELKALDFDRLLDIGCGDGSFLNKCSEILPGKSLHGCDISAKAIGFARAFNPGLDVFLFDFSGDRGFEGKACYDAVTLIEVLEHIEPGKVRDFVENFYRVLKKDGLLFLTVPSKNLKLNKKHFQHFNYEELAGLLDGLFTIEKVFYLNKISIKERILRRLFSNRFFILNHKGMLSFLYKYYTRHLLFASVGDGKRIFLICRKI